jgi:hypothetical protein
LRVGHLFGGLFYFMSLKQEISDRKSAAETYLQDKHMVWDTMEKLFNGTLADKGSESTKTQVFDHKLSTLLLEREYRVMGQLPTGKVEAISKNDIGTSKLMNLILDKYIIPNANAQWDFLTKFRMVDRYSGLYGNFFSLVDWEVGGKNGYVGPDMWLLNVRDVLPQVGAVSLEDSDYVLVRTWRPLSYFESLTKQKGFKNVPAIITKLKQKAGTKDSRPGQDKSQREQQAYPSGASGTKSGYYEVITQYEKDRWVDYCVDAEMEFRDIDNPHENDELPVVCKYSIPMLDDFMGMSDFERGAPMQNVVNSVWNLYLDAVKMSIYPPILINKDNIAAMSSLKWGPAAKWLVRGSAIDNAVKTLNLDPQGISTFNNTYAAANAAILNMFSTTDTTVTAKQEAGYGKTPQAIAMQQSRENSRDVSDRFFMEQFEKKVVRKMINLTSKMMPKSISIRLFEDEIEDLAKDYPEIEEMYNVKTGKLTVDKSKVSSVIYDYEIIPGSSFAVDKKAQSDNLTSMLDLYMKSQTPNGNTLVTDLEKDGYKLHFGELFKQVVNMSGIPEKDKILEEMRPEEVADKTLNEDSQLFQQAMQQMSGMGQIPAQPTPGMPPQPIPQSPQQSPQPQSPMPGLGGPLG